MGRPEVVIYGASGFTGKHLAWKLAERGIPFIAAGRNRQRLEEQMKATPELADAEYEVVAVEHDESALTKLFKGKRVVHNLVGPYMPLGKPVLHAALAAGCHYLDCTGEQDWLYLLKDEYGKKFSAKGLALLPATATMWNLGLFAAEAVLKTPGIDTLDICYTLSGVPSVSSTLSLMRICCQPQYFLQDKQRVMWPIEKYDVAVPGVHQCLAALPWGGGGESVWLEDDDRVRNCSTLVTFRSRPMMDYVVGRMLEFSEHYQNKSIDEQEAVTNKWAMEIAPKGEQPRENLNLHRAWITCHARGRTNVRSVGIPGVASGYLCTGTMAAYVIDVLLRGQHKKVGFAAAAHAVGVQHLLAELIEHEVMGSPVDLMG